MLFLFCLSWNGVLRAAGVLAESSKKNHGPVYVPLDSWIYPAFRRLAALGYVPDADTLVAPWTRQECLSFVEEAADFASRRSSKTGFGAANNEALRLLSDLRAEFENDTESATEARVESVYARVTQIGGLPLQDSYHFGQTLENDFGRPFGEGTSTDVGFSGYGTAGRFSGYLRTEFQSAPGTPPYPQGVQNVISALDGIPGKPDRGMPGSPRFDPLEMYIGANFHPFNVTIGKQSIWWGPGQSSAFHFSDNAEPIYALRISQSSPVLLPGPFRWLGRIRTEFVLGRLSGHEFPVGPFINAQKITLQLTENLEVGFTRSAIFAGAGHPLTTGGFLQSLFSASSSGGSAFGSANDPGDRRCGFDFRWRVPMLRRYVTVYSDSLADDEPSPLANPKRAAWGPGVYITQLPGLKKLDLRFETYSTWLYRQDEGGRFIYWNTQYRDAYTNDGFLIGSWVGRDARAYAVSSTYWQSGATTLTASYRQTKTGSKFLPGGGTQTDVALDAKVRLRPNLILGVSMQAERYLIPVLGGATNNIAASVGLTYRPTEWAVKP